MIRAEQVQLDARDSKTLVVRVWDAANPGKLQETKMKEDGDAYAATVRPGGVNMEACYVGVYAIADGGAEECLALERMDG